LRRDKANAPSTLADTSDILMQGEEATTEKEPGAGNRTRQQKKEKVKETDGKKPIILVIKEKQIALSYAAAAKKQPANQPPTGPKYSQPAPSQWQTVTKKQKAPKAEGVPAERRRITFHRNEKVLFPQRHDNVIAARINKTL
jgi:hypothetical protein